MPKLRRAISAQGMTKHLQNFQRWFAPHGVQVNAIGPGYFATPLNTTLKNDPAFDAIAELRRQLEEMRQRLEQAGVRGNR